MQELHVQDILGPTQRDVGPRAWRPLSAFVRKDRLNFLPMVKKTILDYFSSQGPDGEQEGSADSFEAFVNDSSQVQSAANDPTAKVKRAKHVATTMDILPSESEPDAIKDILLSDSFLWEYNGTSENIQNIREEKFSGSRAVPGDAHHAEHQGAHRKSLPTNERPTNYSFLAEETAVKSKKEEKAAERYSFMVDIRDRNGVRKGESGYDPTTLYIPEAEFKKFTPFEKQFWNIKKDHFDTVILFKKGAFYEIYENDAEAAARLFDMRTSDRVNMKMAGFPEKSYDVWVPKFLEHGFKIGRVEQVENMIGKKIREKAGERSDKIIGRELKEIVTAGTIYNPDYISEAMPFYMGVVVEESLAERDARGFCILLYDASINKIFFKHISDRSDLNMLKGIFIQYDIREVITSVDLRLVTSLRPLKPITTEAATAKKYEFASESECTCYLYLSNYMSKLCRADVLEHAAVSTLEMADSYPLDGSTLASLDILVNNYDGTTKHTLLSTINNCATPFGQRLIKRWLMNPLTNIARINERRRHAAVFADIDLGDIIEKLKQTGDPERRICRLSNSNMRFKDLAASIDSLSRCNDFLLHFSESKVVIEKSPELTKLAYENRKSLSAILGEYSKLFKMAADEVVPGEANDELAQLKREYNKVEQSIASYLKNLKEGSGLHMLTYKSINRDLYQVEAPVSIAMPSEFYTVSSTKTHRRYYSPTLKALVTQLQEAEERIFQAKGNLFRNAVDFLIPHTAALCQIAFFIACIDCYISFAITNKSYCLVMPELTEGPSRLRITGCRSPVFPRHVRNDFMPAHKITLVSGPNMGGKSTFLRGICLNIILAQIGMGVLCETMSAPVFDQIFTRIGASDSLARGESTFMAELSETSRIIRNATAQSFIIMDELGRGTSTADGSAIARAVLDYIKDVGCYTLFSTHYHNLVQNYMDADKVYMDCVIDNGDIVFLYKVRDGVCSESHGLYVARLAGVPDSVVDRAKEIKANLLLNN